MTEEAFNKLESVNPALAFTIPFPEKDIPGDKVDIKNFGISPEDQEKDGAYVAKMTRSEDMKPTGTMQAIALYSKVCKTPEQFAYYCYMLGRFDSMLHPQLDELMKFRAVGELSTEERAAIIARMIKKGEQS